jgi:hypothetical protein
MDEQSGGSGPQYSPDGKWWWDGQKWVAVEQPQPQPAPTPGPPQLKVTTGRKVLLGIVAGSLLLLMAVCTIAVASNPQTQQGAKAGASAAAATAAASTPTQPPKTPAPTATPTATHAPPQPRVLLDLAGTGIKNSDEFSAPSHWRIHYTYDCSSFGQQGNFQIYVEEGSTPVDAPVNELGAKGDSTTDVYHAGTVHLSMNSECDWHVTATTT